MKSLFTPISTLVVGIIIGHFVVPMVLSKVN